MARTPLRGEKAIIIDTDSYAGNFEREMVAYITGEIGECEVGAAFAELAKAELDKKTRRWFENNVCSMPDDHGVFRPATIVQTPGSSKYNSVEFCVETWPPEPIIGLILVRAKAFCETVRSKLDKFALEPITPTAVRFVDRVVISKTVNTFKL